MEECTEYAGEKSEPQAKGVELDEPRWHLIKNDGELISFATKSMLREAIDVMDTEVIRTIINGRLVPTRKSVAF